jgi:predicted transcriptional regulator
MERRKKLIPISIRLNADVKTALEEIAAEDERSVASLINRTMRDYIQSVRGKPKKG